LLPSIEQETVAAFVFKYFLKFILNGTKMLKIAEFQGKKGF